MGTPTTQTKQPWLLWLLSFNGGFVDTAGFIGLQELFTAHVTGNFVTLGAALVFGTKGIVAKLIALPEFMAVIAVAHLAGPALTARGLPTLRIMLAAKGAVSHRFLLAGSDARPVPR